VFLVAGQVNKEVGRQLRALYPPLRALALAGATNHELFPRLMDRMATLHMPDQVPDTVGFLGELVQWWSEVLRVMGCR
jgi:hypothetical protein